VKYFYLPISDKLVIRSDHLHRLMEIGFAMIGGVRKF